MSRTSEMIVNNNYHNIACKCSDISKSKNKNGFSKEPQDTINERSPTFMSNNKKSFTESITSSHNPNLSIIETHFEERTRNGTLPLRDLYVEKENNQNKKEKKSNLSTQNVPKKSKVKASCKYEEKEPEVPCDLKNKNGFRNSFKEKYFYGFNRSKRKSKRAAKKAKLEELVDSDVSVSATESDIGSELRNDDIFCDIVPEQSDMIEQHLDLLEENNSFATESPETEKNEISIVFNLDSLKHGNFNEDIINMVKKRRKTNVTDLLKCKCLERNLNDFHKFITEDETKKEANNIDMKATEDMILDDNQINSHGHTTQNEWTYSKISGQLVQLTARNSVTSTSNQSTNIKSFPVNDEEPKHANEPLSSRFIGKDQTMDMADSMKNFIDVSSRRVKDVIQLFEAAAQQNETPSVLKKENPASPKIERKEPCLTLTTSEELTQKPSEITNKQIVDKKTFFQRLSSWPLLKPRNKVVRRATPMKTLNQLRQHLPANDSDVDSIADSGRDADGEESDVTESTGTPDVEDCESSVSKTSVTYCQKVQLKSFQHIIQEIDESYQVSQTENFH